MRIVNVMQLFCNAFRVIRIGAREIVAHTPPPRLLSSHSLLSILLLHLLNAASAIAIDNTDGGSSALQIDEPSQTLLDHTYSHFLPSRSGIVQLFEWKFADIAKECEEFLGPHGYAGVQVSPVTEHLMVRSAAIEHPWWERYQPLSFQIASRSGSEADFQQMSRACNTAGVRVYVDVVLNHLAGAYDEDTASGERLLEGYAGSIANASSYDFPAFPFTRNHFHAPCELVNYMDAHVVRNCALNGWPDLDHSRLEVRGNLTDLLNHLVDLGVAGFRVDSAKYIWPIDIKLLFKDVKDLNSDEFDFPENARPFVYQDVVDLGVDSISKTEYSSYGLVTDYLYAAELANIINGKAPLSSLINWGPAMGFLPHQQALVFVDCHDGQRDSTLLGANKLLSYKQPRKYIMAIAFMLAHPYGRVKRIMSSYYFAIEQPEQGPPMEEGEVEEQEANAHAEAEAEAAVAEGEEMEGGMDGIGDDEAAEADAPQSQIRSPTFDATTGRCERDSGWVCEHRWPPIVNMIELVNTLNEVEDGVVNFQTDGPNHIAFCRGAKAFFAFNSDAQLAYDAEVVTCLPSGVYCDMISGGRAGDAESATDCVGKRIVVDAEGKAHIMLPAVLGDAGAVAGSDYDEADVEANDAYGLAVGVAGEFGVLAIYEGSRLEDDVTTAEKESVENTADVPSTDDDAKEIATEAVKEDDTEDSDDAADAENAKETTETADVTKENVSTEELEGAVIEMEKNGKLEEAASNASVENAGEEGEAAAGAEDEGEGEANEEKSEGEEVGGEDVETPAEELPAPDEGEKSPEVDAEAAEDAANEGDNEEAAVNADETADELAADDPVAAADPQEGEEANALADDGTDKAEEAAAAETEDQTEKGVLDEAKNKLEEIEKEVTDVLKKVEEEIADYTIEPASESGTGVKVVAEAIANKTNRVLAKAGFNGASRMTQRYEHASAKSSLTINPR